MILKDIFLKSFRSHQKADYSFSPHTTIIIGPNAVGKTNILEAIFMLAIGKSFRAESDRDVVSRGSELARVKGRVITREGPNDLETIVTRGEVAHAKVQIKRFLVNGIARRQLDFIGRLRLVLFWPEDLGLVTESPSARRRYLDFVLLQVDREYRRCQLSYDKGLRQRNRLLEKIRDGQATRSQLLFWDQLLIRTGNYLTDVRASYIEAVNQSDKPFGEYLLIYEASIISETRLNRYTDEEVAAASTLVGPHRDDFAFFENQRDLAKYGSRGEQRLAILWLKLAELEFVSVRTGERPILLLDDIFSELDHTHREQVVRVMEKQQTILTTTDQHFLPEDLVKLAKVIELK